VRSINTFKILREELRECSNSSDIVRTLSIQATSSITASVDTSWSLLSRIWLLQGSIGLSFLYSSRSDGLDIIFGGPWQRRYLHPTYDDKMSTIIPTTEGARVDWGKAKNNFLDFAFSLRGRHDCSISDDQAKSIRLTERELRLPDLACAFVTANFSGRCHAKRRTSVYDLGNKN
jgi:hypothetical protein